MPSKQKAEAVQLPKDVQQELTLLRGFRDLVSERWGYFLGRRLTQSEMNEATKTERKKASGIRKELGDNLEEMIKKADIEGYLKLKKALKEATEVVSKKAKPFREKISPLRKAQQYLDIVAIPDSLKELGTPVEPRFSLSKWVTDALQTQKKK